MCENIHAPSTKDLNYDTLHMSFPLGVFPKVGCCPFPKVGRWGWIMACGFYLTAMFNETMRGLKKRNEDER